MNPPVHACALKAEPSAEIPGRSTIDFYDRNAASYARSTRSLSLQPEIEYFSMQIADGEPILDVGCGGGRDLLALRQAGRSPTGLELSTELAEIAREYSGCPVVVGDMRDPPFTNASFAGLWAAASLLHLERDEMVPTLRRLRRLLEPGGVFFASLKMGVGSERAPDGRLFTYFMPEEWTSLLGTAGFAEVHSASEVVGARRPEGPASAWLQSLARAN